MEPAAQLLSFSPAACVAPWISSDVVALCFGRRGRDRTCNPRLRRPVLYPIELLARSGMTA